MTVFPFLLFLPAKQYNNALYLAKHHQCHRAGATDVMASGGCDGCLE